MELIDDILQDRDLKGDSHTWANRMSILSLFSCKYCVKKHGTIVNITILGNKTELEINVHERCHCVYVPMRTKESGKATQNGPNGADVYLMYFNELPDYYVTKEYAEDSGWISWKGNLADVLPGKMIGGNIYKNKEKKLPDSKGRIWYEADMDYSSGYRNRRRILYSNDGLIFVSYDHYQTFYEITT